MPEGECEGFQDVGVRALPVGWMGGERFGGGGGKGVIGISKAGLLIALIELVVLRPVLVIK